MLSRQENQMLTSFGKDTPMGELLRRYWWPIAGCSELARNPVKPVRLLGESLTLFRDREGRLGLIGDRCAHRGVALKHGYPEGKGLRCIYHGWLYDATGQCIEMPAEDPDLDFKDRVKIPGYPVQELGGLVWAYLGPQPAPLVPRWDLLVNDRAVRQIGASILPCNWLQTMENSVDPVHTEWLHGWFFKYHLQRLEKDGRRPAEWPDEALAGFQRHHKNIDFEIYKYGILKKRLLEGLPEDSDDWRIGHPLVFPGMVRISLMGVGASYQIRVPIDDTSTLHLEYDAFNPPPGAEPIRQQPDEIPWFEVPLTYVDGNPIMDYILSQDIVAWIAQGEIADRNTEHLAPSDRGIILFRKLLKEQIDIVSRGEEPMNVFRDPGANQCIELAPPEYGKNFAYTQLSLKRQQTGVHSPLLAQLEEMYLRTVEVLLQPA